MPTRPRPSRDPLLGALESGERYAGLPTDQPVDVGGSELHASLDAARTEALATMLHAVTRGSPQLTCCCLITACALLVWRTDPSARVLVWTTPSRDGDASPIFLDHDARAPQRVRDLLVEVRAQLAAARADTLELAALAPSDPRRSLGVRVGDALPSLPPQRRPTLCFEWQTREPPELTVRYDAGALSSASARAYLDALARVLEHALADVNLDARALLPPLTSDDAGPAAPGPVNDLLVDVAAQRVRDLDAPAVIADDPALNLSREALATRFMRVAAALRARGLGPTDCVAVLASPGPTAAVATLGVLAAHACVVPLDPSLPSPRLRALVDGARVGLVIHDGDTPPGLGVELVDLDGLEREGQRAPLPDLSAPPAELPAYICFTSGTTGQPCPVVVERAALSGHLHAFSSRIGLGADDRVLLSASPGFDVALEQLLAALTVGAAVVAPAKELGPVDVLRALDEHEITVLNLTPSWWRALVEAGLREGLGRTVRHLILGGEAMTPADVGAWRRSGLAHARLHNAYGPTEAVITALVHSFEAAQRDAPQPDSIPLGQPLDGHQPVVLDPWGAPTMPGMVGELYLGGHIAAGYFGQPHASAARFVPDPRRPGARMFATGDLVRLDPAGELVFWGRRDRQVKIRGQRVELTGVECLLRAKVDGAPVRAELISDGVHERLVAFVAAPHGALDGDGLRRELAVASAPAAVPAAIVTVPAWPRDHRGKLDLERLRELGRAALTVGSAGPASSPHEEIVAAIWRQLLGVPQVTRNDDFFDLGGDSLLLMRLVARLQAELGVSPSLRAVFEARTVAAIAKLLAEPTDATSEPAHSPVPVRSDEPHAPLSPAQLGIWLEEHKRPDQRYRCTIAARIRGPLDLDLLERAFTLLRRRHAVLRTSFDLIDGQPRQRVHAEADVGMVRIEHRGPWDAIAEALRARAAEPLPLAPRPPFEVVVFRHDDADHALLVRMHHLATDGPSLQILTRELREIYTALTRGRTLELHQSPSTYADFARTLASRADSPRRHAAVAWWTARLATQRGPTLPATATEHGPDHEPGRLGIVRGALPRDGVRALLARAEEQFCTPFVGLLAAFVTVVQHATGRATVRVATPTSDRPWTWTEAMVGPFTKVLPLTLAPARQRPWPEQLRAVRTELLEAFCRRELEFHELARLAAEGQPRGREAHPLVDVAFVFEQHELDVLELPGVECEPLEFEIGGAKLPLTFTVVREPEQWSVRAEFDPLVHTRAAIESLVDGYAATISALAVASDDQPPQVEVQAWPSAPASTLLPLTLNQQLIWLGQKLLPEVPIYNACMTFELGRRLDARRLRAALDQLVAANEALRTRVVERDGDPGQRVLAEDLARLVEVDLSHADADARAQWFTDWAREPLPLEGPLFHAALVELPNERSVLGLRQHHLTADAGSFVLLFEQLREAYERGGAPIIEPRPAFADYVRYEAQARASKRGVRAREFWRQRLEQPVPGLGFYGPELPARGIEMVRHGYTLGVERSRSLAALADQLRVLSPELSSFTLLATGVFALLHRISGNEVLTLGTPIHARPNAAARRTVGFFMEACPLRVEIELGETLRSLHAKVARDVVTVLRHYPHATPNRPAQRAWNVMLNYHPQRFAREFAGARVTPRWLHTGVGVEALTIQVHDFADVGELLVDLDCNVDALGGDKPDRLFDQLSRVLDALIEDLDRPITAIELTSVDEADALLDRGRADSDAPPARLVHRMFEAAVRTHPEAVATIAPRVRRTLAEVNGRANRLARHLERLGIGPGDVVAVAHPPDDGLLESLLAVLKASATYLPLALSDPDRRLELAVRSAGARAVITTTDQASRFAGAVEEVVAFDGLEPILAQLSAEDLPSSVDPIHPLYIIHTSGSTGAPKGVAVSHRSFARLLDWYIDATELHADSRVALVSAISFDLTQKNFFAPALVGGALLLPGATTLDPVANRRWFASQRPTLVNCTPSQLIAMIHDSDADGNAGFDSLAWVVLGGESIRVDQLEPLWSRPSFRASFMNSYGPTECTDVVAYHVADDIRSYATEPFPIGRPISGVNLYVLDHGQLVPDGCVGELHIGGACVGLGYVGDGRKTAARYLPDPFVDTPGARMYQTGDRVRWTSGGLVYLGRVDRQIKLHGNRIEPGEVEAALRLHPAVHAAAVTVVGEPGAARLCAYLVADPTADPTADPRPPLTELRAFVAQHLPRAMIPSVVHWLDELPLTPHAKIDYLALAAIAAAPADATMTVTARCPLSDCERTLAAIWAELLEVPVAHADDDFFALGGHSFLAIRLASRVHDVFEVELPMREVFTRTDLRSMADYIEAAVTRAVLDMDDASVSRELARLDGEETSR